MLGPQTESLRSTSPALYMTPAGAQPVDSFAQAVPAGAGFARLPSALRVPKAIAHAVECRGTAAVATPQTRHYEPALELGARGAGAQPSTGEERRLGHGCTPPAGCDDVDTGRSGWRRRAELNRGTRICNPLPSHSATAPGTKTR